MTPFVRVYYNKEQLSTNENPKYTPIYYRKLN